MNGKVYVDLGPHVNIISITWLGGGSFTFTLDDEETARLRDKLSLFRTLEEASMEAEAYDAPRAPQDPSHLEFMNLEAEGLIKPE